MSYNSSTRDQMMFVLDDIENTLFEVIEAGFAPAKIPKNQSFDFPAYVDIICWKIGEFDKLIELAQEQDQIEDKIDEVRREVEELDAEINKLQSKLKEVEQLLATGIFQANQKMASIYRSTKRSVASEDIIKYAHRISTVNAVSAPLTWCPGDVRRPYPTDLEMRAGFLGKSDLNFNGTAVATQNNVAEAQQQRTIANADVPNSSANFAPTSQFNWNNLGELHMSMGGGSGNSVSLETRAHKEATQDDVEVMSTDSSSSSSSDSQ